jgi:hypothetical protein
MDDDDLNTTDTAGLSVGMPTARRRTVATRRAVRAGHRCVFDSAQ